MVAPACRVAQPPGAAPGGAAFTILLDDGRPPRALVDWAGRDPDSARPRADGGRQRASVPPPGTALRGGSRLLGDGLERRDRAPQRAHARLPPCRRGRASARDPAVRLRPLRNGRVRADDRGCRRRPGRPQLRLPRPQGDQDRRGRHAARGPGPRGAHRRGHRRRGRHPRDREGAPGDARRVARLPGCRAAPRRRGGRGAHAPPALGAADVHRHRRPRAHRRARLARGRPGDRLGGHLLACGRTGRAGADGGGRCHGRARRAGESVGARGDRGRRRARAVTRGDRLRARVVPSRGGARARRAPRERVPQEVLRLVPGSRALSARVQAAARRARLDRRGRGPALRRRPAAIDLVERLEAEIPPGDAVTLELPISIYGGG